MKKMKRLAALLLVLVMTLNSMPLSVFAEGDSDAEPVLPVSDLSEPIFEAESAAADPEEIVETPDLTAPIDAVETPALALPPSIVGLGVPADAAAELTDIQKSILEKAQGLYGSGCTQLELIVTGGPYEDILAGMDTVQYNIFINYANADTFALGTDASPTLYNSYYNNVVTLKLPDGLILSNDMMQSMVEGYKGLIESVTREGNTYTIRLEDRDAFASSTAEFAINLTVCGNGTENAVKSYTFAADAVSCTGSFMILDKTGDEVVELREYTQATSTTMNPVKTHTPDEWLIEKSIKKNGGNDIKIDKDAKTATVTWIVELGLKNSGADSETASSVMMREPDAYTELNGRDAIERISVWEHMMAYKLKADGSGLGNPALKSVTAVRTGENYASVSAPGADFDLISLLPLDTRKIDSNGDKVADFDVPVYTKYEITAVYELTDDMIAHFTEENRKIECDNEARLSYKLYNTPNPPEQHASAKAEAKLPKHEPAELNISKKLYKYGANDAAPYDGSHGSITYQISAGTSFDVWVKEGNTYKSLDGTKNEHTVSAGTTYYLTAGVKYTVTEKMTSEQQAKMELLSSSNTVKTPAESDSWKAEFINVEKFGKITVTKLSDSGAKLSGAKFRLYKSDGVTPYGEECITNGKGQIVMDRIPFGTYKLKEIAAPNGYKITNNEGWTLVVDKDHRTLDISATNEKTFAQLTLTKYLGIPTSKEGTLRNFGEFKLQRRTSETGEWETVTKTYDGEAVSAAMSTNGSGQISLALPAFDTAGNQYTYRFFETLPGDYYDPAHSTATSAVSEEVKLIGSNGKAADQSVEMFNCKKVTVRAEKHFYDVSTADGSMTENTAKTTIVTLYKSVDGTSFEKVGEKTAGTAVWENLPSYEGGNKLSYYITEEETAGYKLDIQSSTGVTVSGDKLRVTAPENIVLNNVQQKVPVRIVKQEYYTGDYVSDCTARIAKGSATEFEGEIKDGGTIVLLDTGASYTLTESDCPSGYSFAEIAAPNGASGANAVIDLSAVQVTTGTAVQTYTVKNKQDPKVTILKKDQKDNSSISGAEFTVYTKSGDNYVPYKLDGSIVKFTANVTELNLPEGQYYVAETTVPNGYINPNKVPAEYTSLGGVHHEGSGLTFFSMNVKRSGNDNAFTLTVKNKKNTAAITVTKNINGKQTDVKGFPMQVVGGSYNTTVKTSGSKSQAKFTNLPVYDPTTWEKISYSVSESATLPDGLKDTYYYHSGNTSVTLNPGETKNVTIDNETYITRSAQKFYYHTWEYGYTAMEYKRAGIRMGLYKWNADGGVWEYAGNTLTDANGRVSFNKLRQDSTYAIVEMKLTEDESKDAYKNLYPYQSGEKQYAENTSSIDAGDLSKYNALVFYGTDQPAKQASNPAAGQEKLYNRDHWVQFQFTKYLDAVPLKDGGYDTEVHKDEDSLYDDAVYRFYRYEMKDKTAISFDLSTCETDGWELIGTYSSGSAYDANYERMPGVFMTDVDQDVSRDVVYMLVETSSGPHGAMINPNFKYTFCCADGQSYTVQVPGEYPARVLPYEFDTVTKDDLLNVADEGEGEKVLISDIRIAKWQDSVDDNGNLRHAYTPLPNVTFGVYLDQSCSVLLEKMTVGLDNPSDLGDKEPKAWAQSAAYKLMAGSDGVYNDLTVFAQDAKVYSDLASVETKVIDGQTFYCVPVYLKEESIPAGYSVDRTARPLYLCFLDPVDSLESRVFSDAFFAERSTDNDPLADTQVGCAFRATVGEGHDATVYGSAPYRIVNYPKIDTIVTVRKFGYTPSADTLYKNGDALDAMSIARTPLAGVEMKLQRLDGTSWRDWKYPTSEYGAWSFKTGDNGTFVFAKGLPHGTYRIIETGKGIPEEYENAYDENHARVFTVDEESRLISLYNPTKASLSLTKQGIDGTELTGTEFSLKLKNTDTTLVSQEKAGKAVFEKIASGEYTLSETKAPAGYSKEYFAKYVATLPEGNFLKALADGAKIGYTYARKGSETESDITIDAIGLGTAAASYAVKDPSLSTFSIKKTDEENGGALKNAEFALYYYQFASWSAANVNPDVSSTGWNDQGTVTITSDDGILSFSGKEPGVYAFKETGAPENYEIIKGSDGKDLIYYVVVTGGMPVEVTGLPSERTVDSNGTTKNVQVLYTGEAAQAVVQNRPLVALKASKRVEKGQSTEELRWTVTLNLYAAENSTTPIGCAVIRSTDTKPAAFMESGKPVKLSKGATYFVQEAESADYRLIEINGAEAEPGSRTAVTIPADQDSASAVTVQVVNRYMRGQVTFRKADFDNSETLLTGAEFTVYREDGTTAVSGASVSEIKADGVGTGVYVADIPLRSLTDETFRIIETNAPEGYLMESAELSVTLSPEKNNVDWDDSNNEGEFVTNRKGSWLELEKYDNVYAVIAALSEEEKAEHHAVPAEQIQFQLFEKDGDVWKRAGSPKTIDAEGKVKWLLDPKKTYAVAEADWNRTKYISFESAYSGSTKLDTALTITIGTTVYENCVQIEKPESNLGYQVYNIPALSVRIVKRDVGGYPENAVPVVSFSIYELERKLSAYENAEEMIEGLLADSSIEPVFTGVTAVEDGMTYSSKVWSGRDYTKNYVVVETHVGSANTSTYDTLNKDDARVVWYKAIDADTVPNPALIPEYELDNVFGEASVAIAKAPLVNTSAETAADAAETENAAVNRDGKAVVDSLLKGDRKVTYTLTPNVESHNQPLSRFVVTDSGLTFAPAGQTTQYSITSVFVGKATHSVANLKAAVDDASVCADVLWSDGTNTKTTTVRNLSSLSDGEALMVSAPADFNAVLVSIDYYCEDLRTATGYAIAEDGTVTGYSLGQEFSAAPITVNMTVKQQPDGTVTNPVQPITLFENRTHIDLQYLKWRADGTETDIVSKSANASAVIHVDSLNVPTVGIEKSANITQASPNNQLTYTITVKNESTTERFVDPVVLDMLPVGTAYTGEYTVSGGHTATVTRYTGKETLANKENLEDLTPEEIAELTTGADKETAVVLDMKGNTLEPGESVSITLGVQVYYSAILYGAELDNFAFLSSTSHTYHTVDNPHGYSFQIETGRFPTNENRLDKQASSFQEHLGVSGNLREKCLSDVLGDYAQKNETGKEDDFVWAACSDVLPLSRGNSLTLVKSIRGDKNDSFISSDNFLATSTRTKIVSKGDNEVEYSSGYVDYRLDVINFYNETREYLVISDVLPNRADNRGSIWTVVMDGITHAVFAGKTLTADQYKVFYYTGAAVDADAKTDAALKTAQSWAWPGATAPIPANWHLAADVADKTKVTAFLIAFTDPSLVLEHNQEISVVYHTLTENIPDDNDFAPVGFQNANNTFKTFYKGYPFSNLQVSNTVCVTLMDKGVEVGGDLWIDEDWDGTQETENRRDYSNYAIVNALRNAMSFSITDLRKVASGNSSVVYEENTGGFESVKHFAFKELNAAMLKEGENSPYREDKTLDISKLKTTDPYRYQITAEIGDVKTDTNGRFMAKALTAPKPLTKEYLLSIFELTDLGEGYYMSDNADDTGDVTIANKKDSNFYEVTPGSGIYKTAPFYLHYTAKVDLSKDIGFKMYRDLELEKVAADDETIALSDAKFKLYGPFSDAAAEKVTEENAAAKASEDKLLHFREMSDGSYAYDPTAAEGSVTELRTDGYGRIVISGLNWWKEYIIEETEAPTGYESSGALADGAKALGGNRWLLEIPEASRTEKTDFVTVKNVRKTSAAPEITKILEVLHGGAATLTANQFEFELFDNAEMTGTALQTKKNAAAGAPTVSDGKKIYRADVKFDSIEFTAPGEYSYYIREKVPADSEKVSGYTYSGEVIRVDVSVIWSETDEQLVSTVKYSDAAGETDDPSITNTYTPEDVSATLRVQKVISGPARSGSAIKSFTFVLKQGDTVLQTKTVTDTGAVGFEQTVAFDAIPFTEVGTYEYRLFESNSGDSYYTYDAAERLVTVTVADIGGSLKATVSVKKDGSNVAANPVVFTNTYQPNPVSVMLKAKKAIVCTTAAVPETAKDFTFDLTGAAGSPMPADEAGKTVTVTGEATGSFGLISFTETGTYTYYVKERELTEAQKAAYAGYYFDSVTHEIKIVVSDVDGDLKYTFTVDGAAPSDAEMKDTVLITNTYTPDSVELEIPVEKTFTAESNPRPISKEFTFKIEALDPATAPMPTALVDGVKKQIDTVTVTGEGTVSFAPIAFETVGTYKYKVTEEKTTAAGYTSDEKVYTVIVEVVDDGGELKVKEVSYSYVKGSDDPTAAEKIVFTNNYDPADDDFEFFVSKTFTGQTRPEEKSFTFRIEAVSPSDAPMPEKDGATVDTVSLTGPVTEISEKMTFDKAGEYVYKIKEAKPDDAAAEADYKGYSFDDAEYTVTVTVKDLDGKLEAAVTGVKRTSAAAGTETLSADAEIVFTNDYVPAPVKIQLPVKKLITGNPTPTDKTFTFVLGSETGAPLPASGKYETEIVGATGSGTPALFDEVELTEAGTYYYTVKEKEGTDLGYHYDPATHTYTVKVTDEGGFLTAVWTVDDTEETVAEFTNIYEPEAASIAIPVEKHIIGAAKTVKPFTFVLKAGSETTPMPGTDAFGGEDSITIMGKGTSAFGSIIYKETGVYEYTVSEEKGAAMEYRYDTTSYKVTVTVTDLDGKLDAQMEIKSVSRTGAESDAEKISFVNIYKPAPALISIPVTKTVTGFVKPGYEADFTFVIEAVSPSDAPMPGSGATVTITGSGSAEFTNIVFNSTGTYKYQISEIAGSDLSYIYDTTVYLITVVVTDIGGGLIADVTIEGGETDDVIFNNVKHPNTGIDDDSPDDPGHGGDTPDDPGHGGDDGKGGDHGKGEGADDSMSIPYTGYGPDRSALLYTLGGVSLLALLIALRKKKQRT